MSTSSAGKPGIGLLSLAVGAMLVQQGLSYLSTLVFPVAMPALSQALGIGTAYAGLYTGLCFAVSSMGQLSCGGLIVRLGALRVSQLSLLLLGTGLFLAAAGEIWLFALSALVLGFGNSVSTPASSHLLSRYSPPKYAPLIFSIKQTGVPVGAMTAGVAVPLLVVTYGWQSAFIVFGCICWVFGLAIQPLRREFDSDRQPRHQLSFAAIGATIRTVWGDEGLRGYAYAMFCFVGLQAIFGSFFVSYLSDGMGYSLTAAGGIFALAQAIAIVARIAWGWIGSRWIDPRLVLGGLGLAMAVASLAVAAIGFGASYWTILAIGVAYSATAVGWHGLLLAEVARRAPPGRIGAITGGVVAFGGAGMMTYPLLHAGLLQLTGAYGWGFALAAFPAAIVGLRLIRGGRQTR
ncbi:fucose permease [Stella humosa]|uniref:Fucose permease n=1 Tax=Stella humosa TaxID=94 RepID=A0A3N1KPF0_9PROT|nr:MFS transporter [Stella humosa]ROP83623.1 fucose permease [Stella humosa]BBK33103.1 MFS transporter [Stella humosa]